MTSVVNFTPSLVLALHIANGDWFEAAGHPHALRMTTNTAGGGNSVAESHDSDPANDFVVVNIPQTTWARKLPDPVHTSVETYTFPPQ